MPSPDRLVVVAGTGTEVGKTWVTCGVTRVLRDRGLRVAARKPAQSFDPADPPSTRDAALLGDATGEPPEVVCLPSRSYALAMAPPMAAGVLGRRPIVLADLVAELTWPDGIDVGFVETAGGVRSPLASDGDNVALCDAIGPDVVVLVSEPGLGAINLVRLSVASLSAYRVVVMLNRYSGFDDLHARNRTWLADVDRLDVCVTVAELGAAITSL